MGRGEVKGELLDDLWRRLNQPSNLGRRPMRNEARRVGEMAREGWVLRCDVEDLLADHDERTWGLDAFDLARAFGLAPDLVWTVHSRRQTSFVGSDRLAAADVAALLIRVERLGFEVDPTAMADAVCPTLEGRRLLTDGELTVLNWAKERHKTADIRLQRVASDARWRRSGPGRAIARPRSCSREERCIPWRSAHRASGSRGRRSRPNAPTEE